MGVTTELAEIRSRSFLPRLKACFPERSAAESKDLRLFLPLPFLTQPPIGVPQGLGSHTWDTTNPTRSF